MIKINKLSKHLPLGSGQSAQSSRRSQPEIHENEIPGLVGESGSASQHWAVLARLTPQNFWSRHLQR